MPSSSLDDVLTLQLHVLRARQQSSPLGFQGSNNLHGLESVCLGVRPVCAASCELHDVGVPVGRCADLLHLPELSVQPPADQVLQPDIGERVAIFPEQVVGTLFEEYSHLPRKALGINLSGAHIDDKRLLRMLRARSMTRRPPEHGNTSRAERVLQLIQHDRSVVCLPFCHTRADGRSQEDNLRIVGQFLRCFMATDLGPSPHNLGEHIREHG
mmetsp:Transcript_169771/g.544858  ORF Transcript_169771/g.544858 Transcript_169771/m.544858 type:complete len:213 (-) Transcript_169771:88-726(-)